MILGINSGVDNATYHADKTAYSSSALKTILKSKQDFYKRYILREPEDVKNVGALNMGTALHTRILEPHLFETEIAVFPGAMRRGREWELFSKENKKTIITLSELDKVNNMYDSYANNPTAVNLTEGCDYEHTLVADYEGIRLKVRCDGIHIEKGYILDVKSTSYASGADIFRDVIAQLSYDLSGYMYCKVASLVYDKKFDFYFVVCSKSDGQCRVYKMSNETMAEGKKAFTYSIDTLKKSLLTNNWDDDSLELEDNETIEEV